MSNFLNKIPVSPITSFGNPSVPNGSTFGTNFSILQTGGFMEVYTLSGLTYTIPPATTGIIEFSGNSIPIQFTKGSGSVFSPDVLTLNSDNISSGRRKLGMLAYVYETNKIYQFRIDNYDTLWNNATGATGPGGPTVVISDFGTTVKNNSPEGQSFIDAWTASTISGVDGYDDTNASWRVLSTGGSGGGGTSITGGTFDHGTETLSLYNSTGGTITITGFTDVNVTGGTYSGGTIIFRNNTGGTFNVTGLYTGATDVFVTGGTYSGGTIIFTNNTGGTFNVEGLFTGATDVFVTGGTYSAGTTTFTNNTGGTFQVTGYTKQGDYVESVTGDGVDNTDPLNPVISQNAKVNVITVTLGDLGLTKFYDNNIMLLFSKLYLNSLNENIPYDTLYQLEITEGTGTTPTYSSSFISTWTANTNETIILPYLFDGTYSGIIDWGDGVQSINSISNNTHTYTNAGIYTITITGTIIGFRFHSQPNTSNIIEIKQWGNIILSNNTNYYSGYYFNECNNLVLTGVTDTPDLSSTPKLDWMFGDCKSLTTINNGNSWDVSNITGMTSMFYGCSNFNQPIGNWDVSNVTDMSFMFVNCFNFNQNIGNWNVSKVRTMNNMFFASPSPGVFNNGGSPSISNWKTSGVTNMSYMFFNQTSFNQDINNWVVSGVTDMSFMFRSTSSFNQPLSGWDVSKVTSMAGMFRLSSFNQPIGNWDVSKVTSMSSMFFSATSFNQNIGNWNISGVTFFDSFMFGKTPLTFSTTNLNAIYNGWSTKNPKTGRTINFGTAKYTSSGQAGKNILTGSTGSGGYGWIITDGGI